MKRARIKYESGRYVVEVNENGKWREFIGIEGEKDDDFTSYPARGMGIEMNPSLATNR